MQDSFTTNVQNIAKHICNENGLSEPKDIEDASVLVLTHIMTTVQGLSNHLPVEGQIDDADAVIGAIFLCFIATPFVLHLKNEGIDLSIKDIISKSGLAVVQFLDSERASAVIVKGIEQYRDLIEAGEEIKNIMDYTNTVHDGLYGYIMSRDEKLLDVFHDLFTSLIDAQENQREGA
jgi:hypothetical protein